MSGLPAVASRRFFGSHGMLLDKKPGADWYVILLQLGFNPCPYVLFLIPSFGLQFVQGEIVLLLQTFTQVRSVS